MNINVITFPPVHLWSDLSTLTYNTNVMFVVDTKVVINTLLPFNTGFLFTITYNTRCQALELVWPRFFNDHKRFDFIVKQWFVYETMIGLWKENTVLWSAEKCFMMEVRLAVYDSVLHELVKTQKNWKHDNVNDEIPLWSHHFKINGLWSVQAWNLNTPARCAHPYSCW